MTVKPSRELVSTKRPSMTSTVAKARSDKSFVEAPQPHSKHSHTRSKHYQEVVVGDTDTGQFGDREVASLNPTKIKAAARSFPGLANG